MAINESETVVETTTTESTADSVTMDPAAKKSSMKSKAAKPSASSAGDFCVYIGPTIQGVIQSGAVYSGTRKDAEALLVSAIEQYPLIAKLIVTDKTLAEDRIKVKKAGNQLNVLYKKLALGQRTN